MGYRTVTVDVDVYVDDVINEADDQELIDELNRRGYTVSKDATEQNDLTDDEITAILERFQMAVPGTTGYNIYEKLRKR
jgi:ectoine hydroxylase-related dioxygenase (phytanoyl-CoA dioxygenase family)